MAYQVYGKKVSKPFVNFAHKVILNNIRPDLTFILKLNITKALQRVKKRKRSNRYDKFSKKFYQKVQRAYINIAKTNNKRYVVLDTSRDTAETEKIIFRKFINVMEKRSY